MSATAPPQVLRAIIAGGGTGGHVIPALAIARELRARYNADVQFIGTPRGIENRLVPAAGFELKLIQVGALKNVSIATRVRTLGDLPRAVLACRRMIKDFKPHLVIGVGGYASGPGMLAAILAGVPTLAFEPNLIPGFANKVVAKFVSAAAVHFKETAKYFRNARVTGVPVRKEFFSLPARQRTSQPTLLIFGGSQGARAINRVVSEALPQIKTTFPELQIIHQTGERQYEDVLSAYNAAGVNGQVSKFIDDMPAAFACADLVLCRSGASTVAEITAAGKPAIFVPFPQAADDHQRRNAEALEHAGAARLIPESEFTAERLIETLREMLASPQVLADMSQRARALAHPNAAAEIAEMAAELAKR